MNESRTNAPKLLLVPAIGAFVRGDLIGLTKKFVSGVEQYQTRWPGPVCVLMQQVTTMGDNLDGLFFRKSDLPFDLVICPFDSSLAADAFRSASVALLSVDFQQTTLSSLCRALGTPCAYTAENTLRTRIQVACTEVRNPIFLARRILSEVALEFKYRRAISIADAIQCNGTPTFAAYSKLSRSPLLFFDTRTSASQLASDVEIRDRIQARRNSSVLRLVFSGRLVAIKGADHLIQVANALSASGRRYTLTICGSGDCEKSMRRAVRKYRLEDRVRFLGTLDFESELVPFLKAEADVFICCHRQGDPSCTYLETMACGVPIAGYDNEAWRGLSGTSGCGWVTPRNRPTKLALRIANLTDEEIDRQSFASRDFAAAHTFETEFRRRTEHLGSLILLPHEAPRA